MTVQDEIRDPATTREELTDLLDYLAGLPDDVRGTGAFSAYEQRVGELSRELVLADMLLHLDLLGKLHNDRVEANDYGRMYQSLSELTQRYQHDAERNWRASRALQWVVVAASAGSVLSAVTAAPALVLPFSGIAASLAGFSVFWFAERTRKREKVATSLSTLREEIIHSFGPSGQVLRPSEYYSASTKRIESLLDEIKAVSQ